MAICSALPEFLHLRQRGGAASDSSRRKADALFWSLVGAWCSTLAAVTFAEG